MKRLWLCFLVLALLIPVWGYFWSATNFPGYRYRLWLNYAGDGFRNLRQGEVKEASDSYSKCLAVAKNYPGAILEQAVGELGLADVEQQKTNYKSALNFYSSALSKFERAAGDKSRRSALLFKEEDCLYGLAQAYAGLKDNTRVEQTYAQALELTTFLPDLVKETKAETLNAYANYLDSVGRQLEAEKQRIIARLEQLPAGDKPPAKGSDKWAQINNLSDDLILLGEQMSKNKKTKDSEWAYLEADTLKRKLFGDMAAERLLPLNRLAELYGQNNMSDKALIKQKEVTNIAERSTDQKSDHVFNAYFTTGMTLLKLQRHPEAAAFFQKALEHAKANSGDLIRKASSAYFLAEAYKYSYKFDLSEKTFLEALTLRRMHPIADYPCVSDILFHYGDLCLVKKEPAKAVVLFREALKEHEADPNKNESVSLISFELANALVQQGKLDEARPIYRTIVNNCQSQKWTVRLNCLEESKKALKEMKAHAP